MSFRDEIERLHAYTRKRPALLAVLRELTEDGMHAQDVESDRTSGTETVLFCWDHERDPDECNRLRKHDDPICTGEPIPKATDPTGETTVRPDRILRRRGLPSEWDHHRHDHPEYPEWQTPPAPPDPEGTTP